jgi:hypothetical protein
VLRVQRRRHLAGLLAHAALLHVPARRHSLLLLLLIEKRVGGALGNGGRVEERRWRASERSRGEEDGERDVRGAAGE